MGFRERKLVLKGFREAAPPFRKLGHGGPSGVASTTSVMGLSPLAGPGIRGSMGSPGKGADGDGRAVVLAAGGLRGRWRTLALLAVVVGVGGGVAMTAFAGARRTAAAVPQMLGLQPPG